MSISTPTKITVPFANSAGTYKNTIPVPSQISITPGAASFTDGFPPLTMTPKASGGLPPFGQDMNGVLFNVTQAIQYSQAGGLFPYDSVFATAVGGYPNGAVVQASDRSCLWLNSVANNTTAPESFGAGWSPLCAYGETLISLSSSNVTLTALQSAKNIIILSGAISTNLNIILPTYLKQWTIVNNCTGAYSVTAKTASGSGVIIANGNAIEVYGDGTNINQSINFAQKSITQISSDSSTNIATTAFVHSLVGGTGTFVTGASGYEISPNGKITQWIPIPSFSSETSATLTFPIAFPHAVFSAIVSTDISSIVGTNANNMFQTYNLTTTNVGVFCQMMYPGSSYPYIGYLIAIGY